MRVQRVSVTAAFDEEAGVWYVLESSLPGLCADAESVDDLLKKLPGMVYDLIVDEAEAQSSEIEVAIDLTARRNLRETVARAA